MGSPSQTEQRSLEYSVTIALLPVITFVIQFLCRSLDDNRLTSWQWIFQHVHAPFVLILLIAGAFCSYGISRLQLPQARQSVLVFAVTFLSIVPFWQEPEVIVDAARYFTQAKYLELYGPGFFLRQWGREIHAWTDMPLVPFLYGSAFSLFGESRVVIQVLTTTLFSLSAVLTCRVGTLLWDEDTGLYGGIFLLGIPYIFTQVPLMLVDVPAMFFFVLSVFVFMIALRKGGVWILLSPPAIVLAVLAKYSAGLMLSVLIVISYVHLAGKNKEEFRSSAYRIVCIAALTMFLAGAVAVIYREVISEQLRLLMSFQAPGLRRWGESFLSTFFFQTHPVLAVSALAACYAAFRNKDRQFIIIAWLIAVVLLLQIRRMRYIIQLLPMVALMASYGIREIRDHFLKKFLVVSVVCSSLVIAYFGYLPFLKTVSTVNLQRAGHYLNTLRVAAVEVRTLCPEHPAGNLTVGIPLLDLFTDKEIIAVPNADCPKPEGSELSSLRFTWEYGLPSFYSDKGKRGETLALIYDNELQKLPGALEKQLNGFRLIKSFDDDDGVFRFRTMVRIFGRDGQGRQSPDRSK